MNTKAIEVIRHSLNAATAALELLTDRVAPTQAAPAQTVVEAAPAQTVVEATPVVSNDEVFSKIVEELDGVYNLRTVSEVTSNLGMDIGFIKRVLEEFDEDYVTKTRRSDSAPLIGLARRN